MNKNQLTEYVDDLLKMALSKVKDLPEAEDLVQETLLAALAVLDQGKTIEHPSAFLATVLNRKYCDRLRQKYRKPLVSMDVMPEVLYEEEDYNRLEHMEDAQNIRRCLANLTRLYREVMVRYYMHGESVPHIAKALGVSQSAVKSRLSTGREHIRKGFEMEKYVQQSYEPDNLWISCCGRNGIDGEPFSLVGNDRISMNLLILAYEKPITLPELANAIGISTTFIEPIVDKLVCGELMCRVADKVYTNMVIFTEKDRTATFREEQQFAIAHYRKVWTELEQGLTELRECEFYKRQSLSRQQKLESFFTLRTVQKAVVRIRDELCGGTQPFEEYPERANGGKWYAFGNRYPMRYQPECDYQDYAVSGECACWIEDCFDLKGLGMRDYDCALGQTHQGYSNSTELMPYRMDAVDVMKMLYAIEIGKEKDLPVINTRCSANVEGFLKLHYLTKNENGRILNDVPVIEKTEWNALCRLSAKYEEIIAGLLRDDLSEIITGTSVVLPSHIKGVPKWLQHLFCGEALPMLILMELQRAGLFLPDYDKENHPIPAVLLTVEK